MQEVILKYSIYSTSVSMFVKSLFVCANKIDLLSKLKKNEETITGRLSKIEKNLSN